jgi:hypothetical protein
MTKYIFVVEATISLGTEVEAESLEEAIEEAKSRAAMSVPYQGQGDDSVCWTTEIDCEPGDGTLVDFHKGQGETFEKACEAWEVMKRGEP